jgi:hypothetical protein
MAKVTVGNMEVTGLDVDQGADGHIIAVRLHGQPVTLGEVTIKIVAGAKPEYKIAGFLKAEAVVGANGVTATAPRRSRRRVP